MALGCVVLAAVAGLATWAGTAWVGAGPRAGGRVVGGAQRPTRRAALPGRGTGGAWVGAPSRSWLSASCPAAGGYLLLVFADSFRWPEWVRDSPFAHVASVPAEPLDVPGALGMLAVAAALAVVGLVGYARRDLRG